MSGIRAHRRYRQGPPVDSVVIGVRLPVATKRELEEMVDQGQAMTVCDAARDLIGQGLDVRRQSERIKASPEAAAAATAAIKKAVAADTLFEWAQALDATQLEGYLQLLTQEREKRYTQSRLV